jgi:molecular chaperone DnaK
VFERLEFGQTTRQWLDAGGIVLLAGQGTKIFTVREQIEDLLPGVRIISNYQETAVAQGLGMQAAVLTGKYRDILLLNSLQYGVGMRLLGPNDPDLQHHNSENLRTTPRHRSHELDPFSEYEGGLISVISPSATIPTRRSEFFTDLTPGATYELEMVELPLSANSTFGRIKIVPSGKAIECSIDVDAGSEVQITILDSEMGRRETYRLENLNRVDD